MNILLNNYYAEYENQYKSSSQLIRVVSENWFKDNMYCPFCSCDNLQVLGFASGFDAQQAFNSLLENDNYLNKTSFKNVFCYQLSNNYEGTRRDFRMEV